MTETPRPDVRNSLRPGNRAALIRGLAFVALMGVVAAGTLVVLQDRLPDPVATHFGGDAPNGYTSVASTALLALGFTIGLGGFFTAAGAMAPGARSVRRVTFGLGITLATFVAGLFLSMTLPQIGLEDAADARMGFLSFAIPLVIAPVVGWVLAGLIRD